MGTEGSTRRKRDERLRSGTTHLVSLARDLVEMFNALRPDPARAVDQVPRWGMR